MGFMKKIIGPIAEIGASFIPGGSTALKLGKAAIGLGGSALGAWGASGKQGGYNQSNNTNLTETQTATEDPLFAQFRQSLIPSMMGEINNAKQPIYGDAQKTAFMNNLNNLASTSMKSLQSNMARMGGLGSGRLGAGLTNIQMGKLGQAANFFSQLPFMEAQARSEHMNPLLSMATGWAGRAPVNTTTTRSGTSDMTGTQSGPGFGKQWATDLGGLAGAAFGDWWKKRPSGTGQPTGWNGGATGLPNY